MSNILRAVSNEPLLSWNEATWSQFIILKSVCQIMFVILWFFHSYALVKLVNEVYLLLLFWIFFACILSKNIRALLKKKKIIVMGNFLFSQGPVAVKMVSELSVYWKRSIIHWGQHNDLKLSCGVRSLAIFLISFVIIGCVNQCSPEKQNQLDIYK